MTTRRGAVAAALEKALVKDGQPEDGAAVALARGYAKQIDADPESLVKLGPLLLAVLVELRMTPKARAGVMRGGVTGDQPGGTKLDELRARRARKD